MAESLASLYIEMDTSQLERGITVLERLQKTLSDAGMPLETLGKQADEAADNVEQLGSRAQQSGRLLDGMLSILKAYMGLQFVQYLLQTADAMQGVNNQLKNLTGSESAALSVRNQLLEIANKTHASFEATASLYTRSATALQQYGYSQQEVLRFTENMNLAMKVGGVAAAEQASALFQLSQALASGRLQGDEFRSIAEAAPGLLDILAKHLGKTRGEIRALASDGKLTSQVIVEAVNASGNSLAAQAAKMELTFGGALNVLKNNWAVFVDDLMNHSGVMKKFGEVVLWGADNLNLLAGAVATLVGIQVARWAVQGGIAVTVWTATLVANAIAAGSVRAALKGMLASVLGLPAATGAAAAGTMTFSAALVTLKGAAAAAWAFILPWLTLAAPFLALGAAVGGAGAAFYTLYNVLRGNSAENPISRWVDKGLDALGLLDSKIESLGTKLYDLFHDDEGKFTVKEIFRREEKKDTAGYSRYDSAARHQNALSANAVSGMDVAKLNEAIGATALKYREQAETVGKTTEEIALMKMAAQRDAAMREIETEARRKYAGNEEKVQAILSKTRAAYNEDIEATRVAMAKLKDAAEAKALGEGIKSSADALEKQAQQLGLTNNQIALLEMQTKREALAKMNGQSAALQAADADLAKAKAAAASIEAYERQQKIGGIIAELETQRDRLGKSSWQLKEMELSALGATRAEIAKAKAIAGVIEQYERQKEVMADLEDLRYQAATAGMDADQKKLYDLERKGASSEQLAEAKSLLEQRRRIEEAAERQREAARLGEQNALNGMTAADSYMAAGQKMQEAADVMMSANYGSKSVNLRPIDAAYERNKASREELSPIGIVGGGASAATVAPSKSYTLRLESGNQEMEGIFLTREDAPQAFEAFLNKAARQVRH